MDDTSGGIMWSSHVNGHTVYKVRSSFASETVITVEWYQYEIFSVIWNLMDIIKDFNIKTFSWKWKSTDWSNVTVEQNRLNVIWKLNGDMWAECHEQGGTTHETDRLSKLQDFWPRQACWKSVTFSIKVGWPQTQGNRGVNYLYLYLLFYRLFTHQVFCSKHGSVVVELTWYLFWHHMWLFSGSWKPLIPYIYIYI